MNRKSLFVLAALACSVVANAAPFTWSQAWNESGVGAFDTVAVFGRGSTLFNPMYGLNAPWTVGVQNPVGSLYKTTYAYGPSVVNLNLSTSGTYDDSSTPQIEFDFVAFRGNTIVEAVRVWYDGDYQASNGDPARWRFDVGGALPHENPVPEPFTMALGLAGLGVAIARRRRRV